MKNEQNRPLNQLQNIGKTVEQCLNEIGVFDEEDLSNVGPVEAYLQIKANYPNRTLPVCYYLYSLQGALDDCHWDRLPAALKQRLKQQIKDR